jgi:hypothetical protein
MFFAPPRDEMLVMLARRDILRYAQEDTVLIAFDSETQDSSLRSAKDKEMDARLRSR